MIDKILFVRHGQTDWNKEHRIMGGVDEPLNTEGREQAKKVRGVLKDEQLAVIFVSPLARAKETGDIIAQAHPDTPIIVADELRERDFGKYEGAVNDGNYFGLWDYQNGTIEDGEDSRAVLNRIAKFIDRIKLEYDGNALLVTHGGVGLMIEAYFSGIPDDGNMLKYASENAEVKVYDVIERSSK